MKRNKAWGVRYFRIIYYNDDLKQFGISDEIVFSDEEVTNKTCELKRKGLNIRISVTDPVKCISMVPTVEEIVQTYVGEYTYDPFLCW